MPPKASIKKSSQAVSEIPLQKANKDKGYTEEDIQRALYACSKENVNCVSIAEAARIFGVKEKTLGHRTRGKQARRKAHEDQQLLTAVQERAVAQFCKNRGWRNEPVDIGELRLMAEELCGVKPGDKWPYAFLDRHLELKRRWAGSGESKRASGLNRTNTTSFFELLEEARQGVEPENIWNCDEKGIVESGGMIQRRVIVGSSQKDPKVTADESRKMVTILECVSATGQVIGLLVIHKGGEKDAEWIRQNTCGAKQV